jgi:hypothetical protein
MGVTLRQVLQESESLKTKEHLPLATLKYMIQHDQKMDYFL